MIRIALLIIITTAIHAAPPPQRLARSVPPEIAAMVASNAPPGAVIRYRYHRAKPFDPARRYKSGDVVIAPDGTPHIALHDVFPANDPPALLVEPLLQMQGRDGSPNRLSSHVVAPADNPPAGYFRAINKSLTIKVRTHIAAHGPRERSVRERPRSAIFRPEALHE